MAESAETPAGNLLFPRRSQATWVCSLQIGVQGECPEDPARQASSQLELFLPLQTSSYCLFLILVFTSAPFATLMSRFSFLPAPLPFKGNLTRRRGWLDSETCLFSPCSGIDDDGSSLMQQKLERQVREGRLCHTSYTPLFCHVEPPQMAIMR